MHSGSGDDGHTSIARVFPRDLTVIVLSNSGGASVIKNTQPLPREPSDALCRWGIQISEDDEIVPARKHSFENGVQAARSSRDSQARWQSVRNSMFA
jgi:hypothetical protein